MGGVGLEWRKMWSVVNVERVEGRKVMCLVDGDVIGRGRLIRKNEGVGCVGGEWGIEMDGAWKEGVRYG